MPKPEPVVPTGGNDRSEPPVPSTELESALPLVTILLVDDNPGNLFALQRILRPLGHRLLTAQSGEAALGLLEKEQVTLILLDVQMPGIDGFETARRVRQRPELGQPAIIFVTAHEDTRERVLEGYALGAVDFVLKPIVPEVLNARISVFVDLFLKTEQIKRQAARELEEERRRNRELAALETLATPEPLTVARRLLGTQSVLRKSAPELFRRSVNYFSEALEMSLEQTMYRVDLDPIAPLRAASEELGRLRAVPRDVVEIYTTAVKEKTQGATPQKARAYLEESRLLALQLMGYLTLYYRSSGPQGEKS